VSSTNVLGEGHLTSFSDVSTSGHPLLTNLLPSYRTMELFLPVPCSADVLNDPSIIEALEGNRKLERKKNSKKIFYLQVPELSAIMKA
jgi:hypothetical protein